MLRLYYYLMRFMPYFSSINTNIVIFFVLGVEILIFSACVYFFIKIRGINKRANVFFSGKDGQSLEELILKNIKNIETMNSEVQEVFDFCNKLHKLVTRSIHKVGLVRFNPFNDIGGDQSFSVALLDGKDSGFIISSLHTKEGTRVYAKPLVEGKSSKYQLTEEELQAIKIASPLKSSKI